MSLTQQFRLMADYNKGMNESLYERASTLTPSELEEDRGAFFGSILGTFNHLLIADAIWLQRFATHPSRFASLQPLLQTGTPTDLAEIMYSNFAQLRQAREVMDAGIIDFTAAAVDGDYTHVLAYSNTRGKPYRRSFGLLVQHFFNHQTHHRGQLTALLGQAGLDYGTTDLLMWIPEVPWTGTVSGWIDLD